MKAAPVIVGTGLVCLDALWLGEDETSPLFAGGTSLNTLVHLHRRGWRTQLFGLIGKDRAGEYILQDLSDLGIDTSGLYAIPSARTPIYVERIEPDGHRFLRECPRCGAAFPPCPEPTADQIDAFIASLPSRVDFCMIERAHSASLRLAQACAQRGAVLYLELNRPGDETVCRELLGMANVFKTAADRRSHFAFLDERAFARLEIETLGSKGVRYRVNGGEWIRQQAIQCDKFVDAAGAGDAFSAELLASFAERNEEPHRWDRNGLEEAFHRAQTAAANNCRFAGARGGMYERDDLLQANDYCCRQST